MKNLTKYIFLACLVLSNYISEGQVTSMWFSSPASYAIDNIVPEGEAIVHQLNLSISSGVGCQYTYEYSRFPGVISSASGYNGLNSVQALVSMESRINRNNYFLCYRM